MKHQQSTQYTVLPIIQVEHQQRIKEYLSKDNQNLKTSLCRFYLRGNCIMKPQFCKFSHGFNQLKIVTENDSIYKTQKERRKAQFLWRKDFNQKALFIIKNIDYYGLQNYQFTPYFKSKNIKESSVQQITKDRSIRIRIRQILHRQNWNLFMSFLENQFPNVDFSISFLSYWFQRVGFSKPQSRCKFGDFMRYITYVMKYKQVNIIMPPRLQHSLFFINGIRKQTLIELNLEQILKFSQKVIKQKNQLVINQDLPIQLYKKYICRYYMSGNCQMSSLQCKYAHSIDQLQYQKGQQFPSKYKRPTIVAEFRQNYKSLYQYLISKGLQITLEQVNNNSQLRHEKRLEMHKQMYSDFIRMIQQQWQVQRITLTMLQRQYTNSGFNHSTHRKFQQLQNVLPDLGYLSEKVIMPPQLKPNATFIYKLPSLQILNQYYKNKIQFAIKNQLEKSPQGQILQSALKRNIYSSHQYFIVPLHVYLKLINRSFQQIVKQLLPHLSNNIFFQTTVENNKKIIDIIKKYYKANKKYIYSFQQIENYIKQQHQVLINLNQFVNFRYSVQIKILQTGKRLYIFPFCQNCYVIDNQQVKKHQKIPRQSLQHLNSKCQSIIKQEQNRFQNQRVVMVDDKQSFLYSKKILQQCRIYGVDLQGKLRKQGKVDLIQISIKNKKHKKIFIFDIFLMFKASEIYLQVVDFLKQVLQDGNRVKILHDCRGDSTALYYCLGIQIKNVFDTSGMEMYLQQKKIYQTQHKPDQIIKKIHAIKVPNLNYVLDKWEAPNGVNIFKDSMKKRFGSSNKAYFEERPINQQFKQYSAQDVQDLIDVYQKMIQEDTEGLSSFIGNIYCKVIKSQYETQQLQDQTNS